MRKKIRTQKGRQPLVGVFCEGKLGYLYNNGERVRMYVCMCVTNFFCGFQNR